MLAAKHMHVETVSDQMTVNGGSGRVGTGSGAELHEVDAKSMRQPDALFRLPSPRLQGNGLLTFLMQETAHRLTTDSCKRERSTAASVYWCLVMHERGTKVQRRAEDHGHSLGRTNDVDAVCEPLKM